MAARVAINGLGRIGRATLRSVLEEPAFELVAVNDVAPADNVAYLLRYDTAYGRFGEPVEARDSRLTVGARTIHALREEDPAQLPWRDLGVELVFECTGVFRTGDALRRHLEAGARRVVLSAPAKDETATVVYGVNEGEAAGRDIVSCASCTTNSIAPVMEIADRRIGVRKATMTTVHAYTAGQELVDGPKGSWRRGRAAALNIVPTSTGAARATGIVLPAIAGRFDGVALRVPVAVGSIADIVFLAARDTSADEVNAIFREEADSDRYRGILGVTEEPIVSADIIGDGRASIVDLTVTAVTDGDLVKVMAWYDNEWGYAQQMVRHARAMVGEPVPSGT